MMMLARASGELCCGVDFLDPNGNVRVTLFADNGDSDNIAGMELKDSKGDFSGAVWSIEEALFLVAPDGTVLAVFDGKIKVEGDLLN